jgi:putative tryptophan/tyrosine transport system substrate-binding protein
LRVATLSNPTNPYCVLAVKNARLGATALGVALDVLDVSTSSGLDAAFLAIRRTRPDAALVIADPWLVSQRARIAELMLEYRLPSMFTYQEHVASGGLVAYATNYYDIFRREALFIDKIFKGAKPADLPIEQPIKFELMINLKTAKALGLEIPRTLLARADEVIE